VSQQETTGWPGPIPPLPRTRGGRISWARWPGFRDRLAAEQGWRCAFCGVRFLDGADPARRPTFEHIVPLSRGGADHPDNIVITCWLDNNQMRANA